METKFLLANNLNESLVLTVWDYNDHRKNTELGAATFELAGLLEDATQEGQEKPILKDGKERGDIRFDVSWYPVLKPEVVDGNEVLPDTCEHLAAFKYSAMFTFHP
jgi:Ca2+-dependent lipid-binding protein